MDDNQCRAEIQMENITAQMQKSLNKVENTINDRQKHIDDRLDGILSQISSLTDSMT